jgi:C1A family cysteine protease
LNTLPSAQNFLSTPISEAEREFINFIATYHRSYGTKEEYEYRLSLFTENFERIKNHSSKTYTVGINHMSDLSDYEYKQLLGVKPETQHSIQEPTVLSEVGLPTSIDWRTLGAVTPVKDQG